MTKLSTSSVLKIGSVMIAMLILFGSAFGVWWTFTRPTEKQVTATKATYKHKGSFDYQIYATGGSLYGSPVDTDVSNPTYFTNLIDSIDVSFGYRFVTQEPITSVSETVEVKALLENPGSWQKEIVLVPEETHSGDLALTFPLDLASIDSLITTIEEETKSYADTNPVTLTAIVHLVADTPSGPIEDDFVQSTRIILSSSTLEWETGLEKSEPGSDALAEYSHEGQFGYAIHLRDNALYGPITLNPPPPEPITVVPWPKGITYFPETVDHVDMSFSYELACATAILESSATTRVDAVLEYPGVWTKTFPLLRDTSETQGFTVSFPVDLAGLLEFTNDVRDEIGLGSTSYDLTVKADVHMVAETDSGTIDEVFSQSLKGTLGLTTFKWTTQLDQSQPGSITETETVPNSVWPVRGVALGGLAVGLVAVPIAASGRKNKWKSSNPLEVEAHQFKMKYKDVVVDVEELPEVTSANTIVVVESLAELAKAADALLKPVLHKAESRRHMYCVIDGATRYEYVSTIGTNNHAVKEE